MQMPPTALQSIFIANIFVGISLVAKFMNFIPSVYLYENGNLFIGNPDINIVGTLNKMVKIVHYLWAKEEMHEENNLLFYIGYIMN